MTRSDETLQHLGMARSALMQAQRELYQRGHDADAQTLAITIEHLNIVIGSELDRA